MRSEGPAGSRLWPAAEGSRRERHGNREPAVGHAASGRGPGGAARMQCWRPCLPPVGVPMLLMPLMPLLPCPPCPPPCPSRPSSHAPPRALPHCHVCSSTCKKCAAGSEVGPSAKTACTACKPGFAISEQRSQLTTFESNYCVACPKNAFRPTSGAISCQARGAGGRPLQSRAGGGGAQRAGAAAAGVAVAGCLLLAACLRLAAIVDA